MAELPALNQVAVPDLWQQQAVAALREGKDVLLVSSGAIALGRRALKLRSGTLKLEESQAAAATGQVRLAEAYADIQDTGAGLWR